MPRPAQSGAFELGHRRRQDEDADEIRRRIGLLELLRPLPVDVEQDVTAPVPALPRSGPRGRAVAIAEHPRPFEQRVIGDERIETGVVDEVIVAPLDLALAWRGAWSPRPK